MHVCERALLVVSPKRPSSHHGHSSSSPSRNTQAHHAAQAARPRTRPPTRYIKTLTKSKHQGSKQSLHKSKHQKRKNRKCEIANISLKIARVQMSNAPAVTKPRGSRMGILVGSMAPTLIRRDLRVAPGSRGFEPLPIPGFIKFAFTAAGLTATLSMTFQRTKHQ